MGTRRLNHSNLEASGVNGSVTDRTGRHSSRQNYLGQSCGVKIIVREAKARLPELRIPPSLHRVVLQ